MTGCEQLFYSSCCQTVRSAVRSGGKDSGLETARTALVSGRGLPRKGRRFLADPKIAAQVRPFDRVRQARESLTSTLVSVEGAPVPNAAGIYGLWLSQAGWQQLGVGPDSASGDWAYLGRSSRTLLSTQNRNNIFPEGRTRQSGVRRTLAALLRSELGLTPTITEDEYRKDRWGLSVTDDRRLAVWLAKHASVGWWESPSYLTDKDLKGVEGQLRERLRPPLNIHGTPTRWRDAIRVARRDMEKLAHERWTAQTR